MRLVAKIVLGLGIFVGCIALGVNTPSVFADSLKSPHYEFFESVLGGTSLVDSQSAHFQATATAGILGLGNSASTNLQLNAGSPTTGDPALAFAVDSSSVSFGTFSAATAMVATATFRVINYTAYGYVVTVFGTPPTYGSHTITAMASTGPSQAGVEQYGINLVANTSPVSIGANPDHGQFGFGSASADYGTPNSYRYVSGETVALAPKSSGQTIYTISYLVNVNSLTPAGQYVGNQTILVTGTY